MNELERLIASVNVPGPSNRLDDRIDMLLAAERSRPATARRRSAAMVCVAACVGLLGFYLGRLSAAPADRAPTDVAATTVSTPGPAPQPALPAGAPTVTRLTVNEEQMAGLFAHSAGREGMFGASSATLEVFTPALNNRSRP